MAYAVTTQKEPTHTRNDGKTFGAISKPHQLLLSFLSSYLALFDALVVGYFLVLTDVVLL